MRERIEETLIQRVVQEERAQAGLKTARYMTAYYAVCSAAAAVLSAVYPTQAWHVLLTVMTVLLSLLTVFQCFGRFDERLQLIRRDQAELERLFSESGSAGADADAIAARLQLITASGAGLTAQERRAYERMKDRSEKWQAARDGRPALPKRLFGYEKFLWWLTEITGILLMALALLLPAAGFALAACGLL